MLITETSILEIERTQNQVAKYALGVPLGTAGICAQLDLGLKPFRQVLYEHQLKFYIRVLNLENSRWVKQALLDHLSMQWQSPYIKYIHGIRTKLGIFELPMLTSRLMCFLKDISSQTPIRNLPPSQCHGSGLSSCTGASCM